MRARRVAAVLVLSFLFGGGSAEVAVQTKRAAERARAERQIGSAGDFVALELLDDLGEVIARPRLIAPLGRPAHLLLRDPSNPGRVRLALHVETTREASGDIGLSWSLEMPGRLLAASGRVSVTPGVEHSLVLADGSLSATLLAMPVPSAAFDAWLESEGARRAPEHAI